jgi:hypothetical protein
MPYRVRPGVVLTSVCGEYLLVAAKEAREHCPYYSQIDESAAFLWRQLASGADEAALERAVLREYEIEDPDLARLSIRRFLEKMTEVGYLLPDAEGGQKHER